MASGTKALSVGHALVRVTLTGTILQLAMVIAGHYDPTVKQCFGWGGMLISTIAGFIFGRAKAIDDRKSAAIGGLAAGGICALLGILESYWLKDVPAWVIGVGTLGSALSGAIGGLFGRWSRRQKRVDLV
jgi:hypothetical protein